MGILFKKRKLEVMLGGKYAQEKRGLQAEKEN